VLRRGSFGATPPELIVALKPVKNLFLEIRFLIFNKLITICTFKKPHG